MQDSALGQPLVAGVELGGTKCVCLLARSPEAVVDRRIVATASPDETLGAIESVLDEWKARHGFAALGIASFGPVDLDLSSPTYGFITTTTKPAWPGTDVARRLQGRAGVPTAFDTDVNGAALAELEWGAGRSLSDLAYMTVGTGVGVGLIVDRRPVHGFGHPELGHVRVARRPGDDWEGACPFHRGCVEGLASGSALEKRLGGRKIEEVASDDPLWESVAWALAQLCHLLVCSTAPKAILVGGGVVEKQPHLLGRIEPLLVESLAGYVALPEDGSYVRRPELGSMAGPLGAVALALGLV